MARSLGRARPLFHAAQHSVAPEIIHMRCLVCGARTFTNALRTAVNDYTLLRCTECSMVQTCPIDSHGACDYSDYGDYLLLSSEEAQKRISYLKAKMRRRFEMVRKRFGTPRALDFGSGASLLCCAGEAAGLDMYGVEPSNKLRAYSKDIVGFDKVYERTENVHGWFDAIFMADVIEHLEPRFSREIMAQLLDHLKIGGLLIGNTPNFDSLNVRLCGHKDPAVAPPSHLCYFTASTLDRYLRSLGLQKETLYTHGLSTNGFMRKHKFERSFVERGLKATPIHAVPLWVMVRISFAAGGYVLGPAGLGYQIQFIYKKVTAHHHHAA